MIEPKVRVSIDLNVEGDLKITELSQKLGLSKADFLRIALGVLEIITEGKERGDRIALVKPNGDLQEILVPA